MKRNFWFGLICTLLFLIPLLWFRADLYSLGEDDTGLSYFNTKGTLNEALSAWYSSDHIPRFEQFAGHALVFNLFLTALRKLTLPQINIQQLIWGLLLSLSFFYIVKVLELFARRRSPAFYLAGLFYSLAPYFFIVEYYFLMPSTFGIVLAPAVFYYYFLALKKNSNLPLFKGAILTLVLSRVLTTPAFINFMTFFGLFILVWGRFNLNWRDFKRNLQRFFVYGVLIVFINIILLLPTLFSLFTDNNSGLRQTYGARNEADYMLNMLSYTHSEIKEIRFIYYLTNIFPETIARLQGFRNYGFYPQYINHFFALSLSLSFFILLGIRDKMNRSKRETLPFLILFIVCLLFISVNLIEALKQFYSFLMIKTPIFNMNRIPSMKFHLSYLFYFSLLTGLAIEDLLRNRMRRFTLVFTIYGFIAVLLPSFIFLNGRFFRDEIPNNWVKAMKFDQTYLDLTKYVRNELRDDTRLLLFPLGYGFGAFIPGDNPNQTYRAMTTGFKTFTKLNLFGNLKILRLQTDSTINQMVEDYFYRHDLSALYSLTKKLNIKYILYIKNIKHLKPFAEIIPVYTYKSPSYFAAVNKKQPVYENTKFALYKVKNYNDLSQISTGDKDTRLSFQKIADFMYLIKIRTKSTESLLFQELFSPGWKLYPISEAEFDCKHPLNLAKNYPEISECKHLNDNWLGNLKLSRFFFKKGFDLPHGVFDGYANIWKINTHEQTRYYALIFEWQKIYVASALFSGLVLVLYLVNIYRNQNEK